MLDLRALDPARQSGPLKDEPRPEYRSYVVTLLISARLLAWLIALLIVAGDERPPENSAHEPLLLVLSLGLIVLGGLYVPLLRGAVRSRLPALAGRDRDLLALAAADMAAVFAIFIYSGGFNTPYYHYGLVALVVPTFLLGWRGSLVILASYILAMVGTWVFAGAGMDGPTPAAPWHDHLTGYGIPGRIISPVLVVLVAQYLAWLARRLEDRERATGAALEDTSVLFRIAQASASEDDADALVGVALKALAGTGRFTHLSAWAREPDCYRRAGAASGEGQDRLSLESSLPEAIAQEAGLAPGEVASTAVVVRQREWGRLLFATSGERRPDDDAQLLRSVVAQVTLGLTRIVLSREQEELAAQHERTRIAREIHDGIAQSIYMLALSLEKSASVAGESTPLGERLAGLVAVAREALIEVRHYIFDLKPLLEGDVSLTSTVRSQAGEFQAVSNLPTDVEVAGEEPHLPVGIRTAIYRMLQEALANAFRHADASEVKVRLAFRDERLTLAVEDDGRGFDVSGQGGRGLGHLKQRCDELGGQLTLTSTRGGGTTVHIALPLKGVPANV